jgi:hypothetical protein
VDESKAGPAPDPIRIPLTTLAADPANPREMSDEARAGLGVSLETFGELGMVFNDRTGQWVSGHQRYERLVSAGAVECMRTGSEGYIEHPKTGERFRVRFVDWDEAKQRMANLVANNPKISGDFTAAALAQLKELEDEDGFGDLGLDALEKELEDGLGVFDASEVPAPGLADGDRAPFRQMTFTVHDEQFQDIEAALSKAKDEGGAESSVNENSNGNALAFVCQRFNRG